MSRRIVVAIIRRTDRILSSTTVDVHEASILESQVGRGTRRFLRNLSNEEAEEPLQRWNLFSDEVNKSQDHPR